MHPELSRAMSSSDGLEGQEPDDVVPRPCRPERIDGDSDPSKQVANTLEREGHIAENAPSPGRGSAARRSARDPKRPGEGRSDRDPQIRARPSSHPGRTRIPRAARRHEPVVAVDARARSSSRTETDRAGGAKSFRECVACPGDLLATTAASVARSDAMPAASAAQLTLNGSSTTARRHERVIRDRVPEPQPGEPEELREAPEDDSGRPDSTSRAGPALEREVIDVGLVRDHHAAAGSESRNALHSSGSSRRPVGLFGSQIHTSLAPT